MGLGPVGPMRAAISDAVCEGRIRSPRDPSVRRSARDFAAATVRAPRAGSRHSCRGGKHGKIDPVGTDEIDPVKTA